MVTDLCRRGEQRTWKADIILSQLTRVVNDNKYEIRPMTAFSTTYSINIPQNRVCTYVHMYMHGIRRTTVVWCMQQLPGFRLKSIKRKRPRGMFTLFTLSHAHHYCFCIINAQLHTLANFGLREMIIHWEIGHEQRDAFHWRVFA